jgi:hypothetical protein
MNTANEVRSSVAQTIAAQLGGLTLKMLGATEIVGFADGLQFRIRGSRKVSKIVIKLDSSDTYTVTFWLGRGLNWTTVAEVEGVYVDSLHALIATHTGLYTRL